MPPVIVSNPAGLLAALKAATAGAVILLSPGRWDPVVIYGFKTPGVITIHSQDPDHPAILPSLMVNQVEGLTFSHLTLATELYNAPTSTQAPIPFRISNVKRVVLDGLSIHGTLDNNPQDDVNGPWLRGSDQVRIVNCEFFQLYNGLVDFDNTNLTISGNSFHDIRNDGIDNGGTSNVVISDNHFTDFYPVGAVGSTGDHADAIQFWTTNTKAPAHDIEITHNTFVRGHGSWIQGIFVTDQVGLPFQHVTITDNMIEGGEYNGVMVGGCAGLTISGNTVRPYTDMTSWIRIEKCTDVTMSGNHAGSFVLKNNGKLTDSHNQRVFAVSPPFRMVKP